MPDAHPEGGQHPILIQWKNTDICADVWCPNPKCGHHNHYDGYFAHYVRCFGCGTVWMLADWVEITEVDAGDTGGMAPLEDRDAS